jgi:hypothetical protein
MLQEANSTQSREKLYPAVLRVKIDCVSEIPERGAKQFEQQK